MAWRLTQQTKHRWLLENVGDADAVDVWVRMGSASIESNVEETAIVERLGPGETLPVMLTPDNDSAPDYAVNVSWRGRRRHRETWVHRR